MTRFIATVWTAFLERIKGRELPGFDAAHIVVVRRADGQRLIICLQIAGIVFFERIEPLKVVRSQMQNERGQQTRRSLLT